MQRVVKALAPCFALALAACATQPVPISQAVPVPAARVFAPGLLLQREGAGVVILSIGDHIVSALSNDPCGGGMVETKIDVSAEKPVTLRIGSDPNGGFGVYPTAF